MKNESKTNFSIGQILTYMLNRYKRHTLPLGIYLLDYFNKQGLLRVSHFGDRITGVIIFRKVKLSKYNDNDRLSHDKRGDCAFVVECCADSKRDLANLEKQMRDTVGKVKHVGMHRRGVLHFYDYNKYMKSLLGKGRL